MEGRWWILLQPYGRNETRVECLNGIQAREVAKAFLMQERGVVTIAFENANH